jgi:long-chain acyl-CoA synthetase
MQCLSLKNQDYTWFQKWPTDVPKSITYPKIALSGVLEEAAKNHPDSVAISYLGRVISYGELDSFSGRFACALAGLGVRKGDRVAVYLPNIPQFIIAYFGALKAGAVVVTISPLHLEREVEFQLADSGAQTIVLLDSLYPIVKAVKEKTSLKNIIVTAANDFSNKPVKCETPENTLNFQDMLKVNSKTLPKTTINPEDLAALQYTGGTTGTPKAAMLTHINLVSNALAFVAWIKGAEAKETFLTALPLFHIYGMTTSMTVPISLSSKMVLMPRFETAKVLETIQKEQVTVFCGVPTMYSALLAHPQFSNYDLTSIRVCISGASSLPPQIQKQFMAVTGGFLAEGYGLTEASPVTHCTPVDPSMRTVKVGSIGLPLPDTQAQIVDLESGTKTLGQGEVGELAVKGPQVMKGYWNKPQETSLVLSGGWLLTGDIACMDNEGYFFIVDRKKDLIKYRDFSVYPRELEDILYEHSAVKLCAVVGKKDQDAGEVPKAFVVLKDGAEASVEEIMAFVNGKVAVYKSIRELEFRKELPVSSAGKVLRRLLEK